MVVGLIGAALILVIPYPAGLLVIAAAALIAGWLLPGSPMQATASVMVPLVVVDVAHTFVDDAFEGAGYAALGLVAGVIIVAFLTHVGARLAFRRAS